MTEWSERALKYKNYRRGGIEPDPPKYRHKRRKKPFRLEYKLDKRITGFLEKLFKAQAKDGWRRWGRYVKEKDALQAGKAALRKRMYKYWRIVNTDTDEVIWEQEADTA